MKLIGAILVALAVWGAWHLHVRASERRQIMAEAAALAKDNAQVILYATDWCGYCRLTRKFLDDQQIAYIEYDIEKSEEGRQQYRDLGVRGVPVLMVKGKLVRGHDPQGILAAMK